MTNNFHEDCPHSKNRKDRLTRATLPVWQHQATTHWQRYQCDNSEQQPAGNVTSVAAPSNNPQTTLPVWQHRATTRRQRYQCGNTEQQHAGNVTSVATPSNNPQTTLPVWQHRATTRRQRYQCGNTEQQLTGNVTSVATPSNSPRVPDTSQILLIFLLTVEVSNRATNNAQKQQPKSELLSGASTCAWGIFLCDFCAGPAFLSPTQSCYIPVRASWTQATRRRPAGLLFFLSLCEASSWFGLCWMKYYR